MYDMFEWKIEDRIGELILNSPPSNKMSKDFFDQLNFLAQNVISKSDVDAVVIFGAGRHFSSGADLDDLFKNILSQTNSKSVSDDIEYPDFLMENINSFLFFQNLKVPVIAAVQGVCLGSALELTLFCDFRVCTKNSLFGFPETGFNLIPGCGGTQKILSFVSYAKALELILQGCNFSADEALSMNIVDKILPKKDFLDNVRKLAKNIAKKPVKKSWRSCDAIRAC